MWRYIKKLLSIQRWQWTIMFMKIAHLCPHFDYLFKRLFTSEFLWLMCLMIQKICSHPSALHKWWMSGRLHRVFPFFSIRTTMIKKKMQKNSSKRLKRLRRVKPICCINMTHGWIHSNLQSENVLWNKSSGFFVTFDFWWYVSMF